MNHEDYSHMQKEFRIANWLLGLAFIFLLTIGITFSCTSMKNICDDGIKRINGEVIYAVPSPNNNRTVTIKTDTGYVKIYRVPMEQPLVNIPVCKAHGRWYWVMP
jgi:hypothetical protein